MKSFLIYILTCLLFIMITNNSKAQAGLRTDNVDINISSGTSLVIPGNVKINGGSDYILNNGTCYIAGNFVNNGNSFDNTSATGTEIFNGTTTISGSKSVFNNFTILPGATVTLSGASIDIYNNWTNNGKFVHGSKIVTFSGTTPVQYIIGSGTFYKLILQNNGSVHFGSSKDTIDFSFSNSNGTMIDGTSKVVFNNGSSLIGNNAKNFYDLEISSGATVSHTTGSGSCNIHVAHSFINGGSLTENNGYAFYFDSSNGTETMSGSGTANFGNLVVGNNGFSLSTTLNCSSDFSVNGGSFTFYKSSVFNTATNQTATFSTAAATVSGTGTANFYNATTNVALNLGASPTVSKITNNLQINTNGSIVTNAPFYNSTATLIYNTITASLPTSIEWTNNTNLTGTGAPYSVSVTNTDAVAIAGDRTIPGNLSLSTGSLNINEHTLTINGASSTSGGTVSGSPNSQLKIGSTGTGTIHITPASPYNELKTLTINSGGNLTLGGSAVTGDTLNIMPGNSSIGYGTVTVDGTLHTNGVLTLKSNSVGTARVATTTSGKILDSVTIERFIPARRAWRFLAVPFSSSNKSIHDAWQEGVNNYGLGISFNQNPHPGYGTHITGNNNSALGYDYNTTTNPSIKVYDSSVSNWSLNEPATISTGINSYRAYCLFVRGSRAVDLSQGIYAAADSTVLRITGILNETGVGSTTQSYTGGAGNWIFVGNPYASSVDLLNLINSTSGIVAKQFWVWDPKINGNNLVGGYVTYANGVMTPLGGSYTSATSVIQSGQAFMVKLSSGSGSSTVPMQFQQTDKTPSESNVFGKKIAHPTIYMNLLNSTDANNLLLTDGVAAAFGDEFSSQVDKNDAQKLYNFDENLELIRDNNKLAIEFRPKPKVSDTLFLKMYLAQHPYSLQILTQNFESMPPLRAWVVDKYLNTKTEINLLDTTVYNFMPNPDTNSYRNRFMLVFNRQLQTNPLPVSKTTNQNNPDITGEANSLASSARGISLYPNPVTEAKNAMLGFNKMDKGNYEVTIYSAKGAKLSSQQMQDNGGTNLYPLQTNAALAAGVYTITVLNEDSKEITTLKLVVSK